jgi:hypothetical protein
MERLYCGCALVQAVSRRLPTAAGRVRTVVKSYDIYVREIDTGAGFFRVLQFPLPISYHRLLHTYRHLSSMAGTVGQEEADVPSGLSLSPPQETKKCKKRRLP